MKTDHRIRMTKLLLHQSLINLLKEKPMNKISVKDICDKAEINRATFYTHYTDAYALLEDIQTNIVNTLLQSVTTKSFINSQLDFYTEICRSITNNRETCEFFFGKQGDLEFQLKIIDIARDQSIMLMRRSNPNATEYDLNMLYNFISNGGLAIIRYWVQNGMKESPEDILLSIEKIATKVLG